MEELERNNGAWLVKSIKNRKLNKKREEIEMLKLDLEAEILKKRIRGIKNE